MKLFSIARITTSAGLLAGLLVTTSARANTVQGSIYENAAGSADAVPGMVPAGTPDVTFTTNSPLNFNSNGSLDYTIGTFLQTNPGGSTILTGSSQLGNTLNNTLFNFTGSVTVTNGETFTVTHDDGMTLIIDGFTVVSAPGPTSAETQTVTYGGPSGTYAFQLVYGETAGAPAVLQVNLPLAVSPEPSSILLMGTGLLGAAAGLKRRWLAA